MIGCEVAYHPFDPVVQDDPYLPSTGSCVIPQRSTAARNGTPGC